MCLLKAALPSDSCLIPARRGRMKVTLSSREALASPCMGFDAFLEARVSNACSPLCAVRAELVDKWKAEREARLARGEEEEEEEEEADIYAVADQEVLGGGAGPPGAHRLLCAAEDGGTVAGSADEGPGSRPGSWPRRRLRLRPSLLDGGDEGRLPGSQGGFQRGTAVRALVKLLYTGDDLRAS